MKKEKPIHTKYFDFPIQGMRRSASDMFFRWCSYDYVKSRIFIYNIVAELTLRKVDTKDKYKTEKDQECADSADILQRELEKETWWHGNVKLNYEQKTPYLNCRCILFTHIALLTSNFQE